VAGSDNTGLQGEDRPVREAHVIKPQSYFGPAGQPAGTLHMGHRGANFASSGNGDAASLDAAKRPVDMERGQRRQGGAHRCTKADAERLTATAPVDCSSSE